MRAGVQGLRFGAREIGQIMIVGSRHLHPGENITATRPPMSV